MSPGPDRDGEALSASPVPLSAVVPSDMVPRSELAFWKDLLTTRTGTLRARAERAEQERDEARAQIDAHLALCNAAPMTTVDEDGRVWRLESHGFIGGKGNFQRSPDPFTTRLYRLVPIEDFDPVTCTCFDPDPDPIGECRMCRRLVNGDDL